jgi:hypothetical protein
MANSWLILDHGVVLFNMIFTLSVVMHVDLLQSSRSVLVLLELLFLAPIEFATWVMEAFFLVMDVVLTYNSINWALTLVY